MKIFATLLISILLYSCATIQPEAPEIIVKATPPLTQPPSTLVVPVKINLAPYFKETDKSIPDKFTGKDEQCDGISYSYVFKREPITFKGSGKSIYFDIDGKYSLNVNYCLKCTDLFDDKGSCVSPRVYVSCGTNGEAMRKVEIQYATSIELTPEFRLKSKTDLNKFKTIDPCEFSVFKYDATSMLKKEVTKVLVGLEKDIDKQIGAVNIRSEADKAWKILAEPIPLGNYGFLNANPTKIGFDNLKFNGNIATASLALSLNPKITTTNQPSKGIPLPKLSDVTDTNGFNVVLDVIATYDSLSKILTKELKGKEIDIKGKKVIFETLDIHGASNQQISLKIGFSGKKKGDFYLVGTPIFDTEKQLISFPDLEFDIKSKSALLKSAKWLFSDKITEVLHQYSTIDLQPHLKSVIQIMEKQLNTTLDQGVTLKGSINKINLNGIYPNNETLIIRVNTTGKLSLEL